MHKSEWGLQCGISGGPRIPQGSNRGSGGRASRTGTIPGQEVRPEAALPLLRSFDWQLEQWRVASVDGFG